MNTARRLPTHVPVEQYEAAVEQATSLALELLQVRQLAQQLGRELDTAHARIRELEARR